MRNSINIDCAPGQRAHVYFSVCVNVQTAAVWPSERLLLLLLLRSIKPIKANFLVEPTKFKKKVKQKSRRGRGGGNALLRWHTAHSAQAQLADLNP